MKSGGHASSLASGTSSRGRRPAPRHPCSPTSSKASSERLTVLPHAEGGVAQGLTFLLLTVKGDWPSVELPTASVARTWNV